MKKIIKILFVLAVALLVGLVVAVKVIDINQYKDVIAVKVEEATGRKLTIAGNIRLDILSLSPSMIIENVSFANALWVAKSDMVSVEYIEAELGILALFRGVIRIKKLVLVKPDILLETDSSGRGNWEFTEKAKTAVESVEQKLQKESKPTSKEPVFGIAVDKVQIKQGKLVYKDGVSGESHKLNLELFEVQTVKAKTLDVFLNAAYNGNSFKVKGNVGSLEALLKPSHEKPYPLNMEITFAGIKTSVKGVIGDIAKLTGIDMQFRLDGENLSGLAKAIGRELPDIEPYSLSMRILGSSQIININDLLVSIGKNSVGGNVELKLDKKVPVVNVYMSSPFIDVASFAPSEKKTETVAVVEKHEEQKTPIAKEKRLFSDEPLPLDALKSVNADISFDVDKLVLPDGAAIEKIRLKLYLSDGKLKISPVSLTIGGGSLEGEVSLDSLKKSLNLNFNGKDIELGRIASDIKQDKGFAGGKTNITIKLKSHGNSVRQLMAKLDGTALVVVDEMDTSIKWTGGESFDGFLNALNLKKEHDKGARLKCAVAKLNIKNGIAVSDRGIALETKKFNVVIDGSVNLKNEKLDVSIHPSSAGKIKIGVGSLVDMVRVRGTIAEPKLKVDAVGVAKTAATIGAAVASGGISLLGQTMFSSIAKDSNPCETALHGYEHKKAVEKTKKKSTTKEDIIKKIKEAPKKFIINPSKDLGKDLENLGKDLGKDLLKGLFGGF